MTSLEGHDFADDLALLSHRIQDMRDKMRALEEQGAKVGLKINATKTKVMRIGTKHGDGVLIAGEPIEEVDEFTYLWSIVNKKGGTDEDIQACIGKARQAFAMPKPIWQSTALTTRTKLRVCVKCEGSALVWFGNLEADQGTEAEVAGVHQQEPEEHPADLVAKKNL